MLDLEVDAGRAVAVVKATVPFEPLADDVGRECACRPARFGLAFPECSTHGDDDESLPFLERARFADAVIRLSPYGSSGVLVGTA